MVNDMDIKDMLIQPKNWMIVSSVVVVLMLGIGPMMASSGDVVDMAEDEFGELYTNASDADKETIEESVKVEAYFFGATNVALTLFILGFAFLTEGTTRSKSAVFCGVSLILWAIYSQGELDMEALGFYSVVSAPMIIAGALHLRDGE
jgi:hypothetical protein|tara:strand:- start:486 stop:929 length:444 start_codon:yes stop_codon:yes gene_type:complete